MGKAADQKLSEIEAARSAIDSDLRELQSRIPAPLRSFKTIIGGLLSSSMAMGLLGWSMRRRRVRRRKAEGAEVILRVSARTKDGQQIGLRKER